MRRFLLCLLLLALTAAALRFDWPGVGTLILAGCAIAAFWPGARRPPVRRRFFIFLAFYLTIAFLGALTVYHAWFYDPSTLPQTGLGNVLFGGNLVRYFWSLCAGCVGAALICVILLLPWAIFHTRTNDNSSDQSTTKHWWSAAYNNTTESIGVGKGTWVVEKGEIKPMPGAQGDITCGGPGNLLIREGHVVLIESAGELSNKYLGCGGPYQLGSQERVCMVVPLFLRSEHMHVSNIATKDKVILNDFEFWVFHKVDAGPADQRADNGEFPYSVEILRDRVWSPGGGDPRGSVRNVAETAARDVIGRYDLEQLIPLSGSPREELKKVLQQQINDVTKEKMGVVVTVVDFGEVKVPDQARQRLLEKWLAECEAEIEETRKRGAIARGQAEAEVISAQEAARAYGQSQMISTILEALNDPDALGRLPQPDQLIALMLIQVLEKLASGPNGSFFLPAELLELLKLRGMGKGEPGTNGNNGSNSPASGAAS